MAFPLLLELIDTIIDRFYEDNETLRTCSLVAHACTPRSQKYLFTRVKLTYPRRGKSSAQVKQLVGLLKPELAGHIRHLLIDNYAEKFSFQRVSKKDKLLPVLLSKLNTLQSFTLSLNVHDGNRMICWLSPEFELALVAMFNSTQVAEVNLHSFADFPVALLAHCPRIKRLNFKNCAGPTRRSNYETDIPAALEPPPTEETGHLEVLYVTTGSLKYLRILYEATQHPHSRLTFAYLQEIVINTDILDVLEFVSKVAVAAGGSVQRLTWDVNPVQNPYHGLNGMNLKSFVLPPSLRSLRLSFIQRGYYSSDSVPRLRLQWLCAALDQNSGHNVLGEIVLVFTIEQIPYVIDVTGLWDDFDGDLKLFDSVLGGLGYAHLYRVAIFVEYTPLCLKPPPKPEEDLPLCSILVSYFRASVEGLKAKLPLLTKKGILNVQWLMTEKQQLGLGVAVRALEEGIQGGVHVGGDGEFKIGHRYTEKGLKNLRLR